MDNKTTRAFHASQIISAMMRSYERYAHGLKFKMILCEDIGGYSGDTIATFGGDDHGFAFKLDDKYPLANEVRSQLTAHSNFVEFVERDGAFYYYEDAEDAYAAAVAAKDREGRS